MITREKYLSLAKVEALVTLIKARRLISKFENWTQGAMARDKDGVPLNQGDLREPVCFCALGALAAAQGLFDKYTFRTSGVFLADTVLEATSRRVSYAPVARANDRKDCASAKAHASVLALYDLTIHWLAQTITARECAQHPEALALSMKYFDDFPEESVGTDFYKAKSLLLKLVLPDEGSRFLMDNPSDFTYVTVVLSPNPAFTTPDGVKKLLP